MFDPAEQERVLKEFLTANVRPYYPETDDYDCPPFAADIKEGKNDPIYNAHSYHTKVPPRSIIPYILHYTRPGDLILDPFCGSGMTGVAAQMCAKPPADILDKFPELRDRVGPRAGILNDLSPAACHIAYNYNTPVDVEVLKREFERIKAAVKDEFDWLYGTEHYEPAVGLYDPANADVDCRLKNPPMETEVSSKLGQMVLDGHTPYGKQDWELLTTVEVEARLGYPVTELPGDKKWGDLDVAKVKQWVCIPATIQYTVWSDVYRCEGFVTIEEPTGRVSTRGKNAGKPITSKKKVGRGCGNHIVLWNAALLKQTGEVLETFNCPKCGQPWKKNQLTRFGEIPVETFYGFQQIGNVSRTSRPVRFQRKLTKRERDFIDEIERRAVPYWYPNDRIDMGREMLLHGLQRRGGMTIGDFFFKRQLWALGRLWREFGSADPRVASAFKFLFTSLHNRYSKRTKWHISRFGQGAMPNNLYIPSLMVENNILDLCVNKFSDICAVSAFVDSHSNRIVVRKGSATRLGEIPDSSVDYVFADPPFGQNIYYADCSLLWEGWLQDFTDEANEIVVSERRTGGNFKDLQEYKRLMNEAFAEMFRVLKPNRWATIEFNNSDGAIFEAIKAAVTSVGFQIANMLLLDKDQKTYKQIQGAKGEADVVDKDVLFNLHKPAVACAEVRAEDHDLERQVADAVRQHLQTLPGRIKADPAKYSDEHRTTATINSMLMNTLIPRGVDVQRLNLAFIQRVCARYFRKVGQRWYLRGEAVGVNGVGLLQEEVAIKDEVTAIAWLRQKLESRPVLIGELKPLWMRATGLLPASISQSLVLEDLLISNFWRDEGTNRWREPTEAERDRINDDKTIRVLHDAERYVAGSLRRQTADTERCEWIDVLFQMCRALEENEPHVLPSIRDLAPDEGYRLIGRLFQGVLKDRVPPAVHSRAAKQTRVASQRIVQGVENKADKAKAKRRKEEEPTLFDL